MIALFVFLFASGIGAALVQPSADSNPTSAPKTFVLPTGFLTDKFLAIVSSKRDDYVTQPKSWPIVFKSFCTDTVYVEYTAKPGIHYGELSLSVGDGIDHIISHQIFSNYAPVNSPQDQKIRDDFCVSSMANEKSLFSSVISQYPQHTISFWVDTSVTAATIKTNRNAKTGEIVIGGVNPNRLVEGTSVSFNLENLAPVKGKKTVGPGGWITYYPAKIEIQSQKKKQKRTIVFDIYEGNTLMPADMFKLVAGSLMQNSDESTGQFPCEEAQKLTGFKMDDLVIPNTFLYDKINDNTCVLRISPHGDSKIKYVNVGFHLIKHFHLEVQYDYPNRYSMAIFSQRTENGQK